MPSCQFGLLSSEITWALAKHQAGVLLATAESIYCRKDHQTNRCLFACLSVSVSASVPESESESVSVYVCAPFLFIV